MTAPNDHGAPARWRALLAIVLATGVSLAVPAPAAAPRPGTPDGGAKPAGGLNGGPDHRAPGLELPAPTDLALRVQSNLAESASLRLSDIRVEANGGGRVTLRGSIRDDRQKARAVRIARRTRGVEAVDVALEVDDAIVPSSIEPPEDGELARMVAESVAASFGNAAVEQSWFSGYQVTGSADGDSAWKLAVDADAGRIELRGRVPSNAHAVKALQAARSVPEVRSIKSALRSEDMRYLGQPPTRGDAALGDHPGAGVHPGTLMSSRDRQGTALVCRLATPPVPARRPAVR